MNRTCDSCGHVNPAGHDFCLRCRNYLRWTLTGAEHTIAPEPLLDRAPTRASNPAQAMPVATGERGNGADPAPGPAPPPPRAGADFSLLAADGTPGDAPYLSVAAGEEVSLSAFVRNRGTVVDHFTLRVEGVPDAWWSATPVVAHLLPYGSHGTCEQEMTIRFHPPRDAHTTAGEWDLRIAVWSRHRGERLAVAPATLVVEAFHELTADLRSTRARGRRRGRFTLALHNSGNAVAVAAVGAHDDEGACRTTCDPARVEVPPGRTVISRVTVRPLRPCWVGRPEDRQISVDAAARDGAPALVRPAIYRQLPWLPSWVLGLLMVLIAVLAAFIALRPKVAVVPDLKGARSGFAAQKILEREGLRLDPRERTQMAPKARAGSVLAQTRDPGSRVPRGTSVGVVVATHSRMRTVPDLRGMTLDDAERALTASSFKLGSWQPTDAPSNGHILMQFPAGGERRPVGTPINVSIAPSAKPGRVIVAPDLTHDGDGHDGGDRGRGEPAADALPPLAFDDTSDIFLLAKGSRAEPLTTDGRAVEPAWDPSGTRIAYVRSDADRSRIFAFSPQDGDYPGEPISDDRAQYRRPAWQPGDGGLVAFIRGSDHAFCLAAATGAAGTTRCHKDPDWMFTRVAWSPRGDAVVLVAQSRHDVHVTGLVHYHAARQSGDPDVWRRSSRAAGLIVRLPAIQHAAYAPDGKRIAVTAGPDTAPSPLYLVSIDGDGRAQTPRAVKGTAGCELAWTSDGRLALATRACSSNNGPVAIVDTSTGESSQIEGVNGGDPAWRPIQEEAG